MADTCDAFHSLMSDGHYWIFDPKSRTRRRSKGGLAIPEYLYSGGRYTSTIFAPYEWWLLLTYKDVSSDRN